MNSTEILDCIVPNSMCPVHRKPLVMRSVEHDAFFPTIKPGCLDCDEAERVKKEAEIAVRVKQAELTVLDL